MTTTGDPKLVVRDLRVTFTNQDVVTHVVKNVSFEISAGKTLGIVGESGSGKTVTSRAVMRMVSEPGVIDHGTILVDGIDVLKLDPAGLRKLRGDRVAMVFQDPQSALNPVVTVGAQIEEALTLHGKSKREARAKALDLLDSVGIPTPAQAAKRYAHQFSGGMRQRIVIAIALANNPSVLIADEPTTALDVTIQAQILELIRDLRERYNIAILLITHDMGVVAEMCDDVLVMLNGEAVEHGPTASVLSAPQHEYTRALLRAVPRMDAPVRHRVASEAQPVLEVTDLRVDLGTQRSITRRAVPFFAVDGVSLSVAPGETLALVGESGCGKSTLSRTIVGIQTATSGQIVVNGRDVTAMTKENRGDVARAAQYVFQDPYSSLNPRRTIGQALEEALLVSATPRRELRDRAAALLERVALDPSHLDRYPHSFSGGQRQRIGIARALAGDPNLLILDEPVSALDVSIQAQILELLTKLQEEMGVAYLFISHNLTVVRGISHRVAVMYKGKIVEIGSTEAVFASPQHAYTQKLLAATPDPENAITR